jgi:hypothetical protein
VPGGAFLFGVKPRTLCGQYLIDIQTCSAYTFPAKKQYLINKPAGVAPLMLRLERANRKNG